MIQMLIDRYKRMRTERFLRQAYQCSYAFVGMGQHALTNLYPVLHHLGVPLKYVCVTTGRKARLIEQKFPGTKGTTSLYEILDDQAVKGVLVSATPSAHYPLASQVLRSGKSLFVEKPPCQTLEELDSLITLQQLHGSPVAVVGLQMRHAPAVQLLRHRLSREQPVSYDLHYQTGAYPEGHALPDLYIHPLDLVCHLFGKPEVIACQRPADGSYLLMLRHPHVVGTLELSTAYTWTAAEVSLKVCTRSGTYRLRQTEELTFEPGRSTILGIPAEKLHARSRTVVHLCERNSFAPILANNQVYTQGYYGEVESFVNQVENGKAENAAGLTSVRDTYELMQEIGLPLRYSQNGPLGAIATLGSSKNEPLGPQGRLRREAEQECCLR